jgi:hypothetical protein
MGCSLMGVGPGQCEFLRTLSGRRFENLTSTHSGAWFERMALVALFSWMLLLLAARPPRSLHALPTPLARSFLAVGSFAERPEGRSQRRPKGKQGAQRGEAVVPQQPGREVARIGGGG